MNGSINDKDEMAAALAHEIKNPISVIRANIDYIKLCVKPNYTKNFTIIDKELNKLTTLISDYTEILKPSMNFETVYLDDLIYDITEEFQIISAKEIKFEYKVDNDIEMRGDYKKLSILLFNIYKNSIEAINLRGKICTKLTQDKEKIKIEIRDNGSGISSDIIEKIGSPFFTTKENGSGLGLMICRQIANMHNGNLSIENIESGCKVTIIFNK